jgi:hypothetical protein
MMSLNGGMTKRKIKMKGNYKIAMNIGEGAMITAVMLLAFWMIASTAFPVFAGETTTSTTDHLTYTIKDGSYLQMNSVTEALNPLNVDVEKKETLSRWKLSYTFTKEIGQKEFIIFLTADTKGMTKITWNTTAVKMGDIIYDFSDAIASGYPVKVANELTKASANTVAVRFNINKCDELETCKIDPFVTTAGVTKQAGSPVSLAGQLYVFWTDRAWSSGLTYGGCNYTVSGSSTEYNCTGIGEGLLNRNTFYAYNSTNGKYHRLFIVDDSDQMRVYNVSKNGMLADEVNITFTNNMITDAIEWNNDFWISSGYIKNVTIANESSGYVFANMQSVVESNTDPGNYGFFANNINGDNNLSVFISNQTQIIEKTTKNGNTWENVSVVTSQVYGMDAISFKGTKYVFYSNLTYSPGILGASLIYVKNTTTGYTAPASIFNPTSMPNQSVREVWAVSPSKDNMYVFFLTVDSMTDAPGHNMSFYRINYTDAGGFKSAEFLESTLWDYDSKSYLGNTFANTIHNGRFYVSTTLEPSGGSQWGVYLWNGTVDATASVGINTYNITVIYPTNITGLFNFTSGETDTMSINNTALLQMNKTGSFFNKTFMPPLAKNGLYWFKVTANDTSNNTVSSVFWINVTDTTNPALTTHNLTYASPAGILVLFNFTDNAFTDSFSVNNTSNWQINKTGYLQNKTYLKPLANNALYWIKLTVNDSVNNTKSVNLWINITDSVAPSITYVWSPANATYNGTSDIDLNFSFVEQNPDQCWYRTSINGTNNTITCANQTKAVMQEGFNRLFICMNDTVGSSFCLSPVNFTTVVGATLPLVTQNLVSITDGSAVTLWTWYNMSNGTTFGLAGSCIASGEITANVSWDGVTKRYQSTGNVVSGVKSTSVTITCSAFGNQSQLSVDDFVIIAGSVTTTTTSGGGGGGSPTVTTIISECELGFVIVDGICVEAPLPPIAIAENAIRNFLFMPLFGVIPLFWIIIGIAAIWILMTNKDIRRKMR